MSDLQLQHYSTIMKLRTLPGGGERVHDSWQLLCMTQPGRAQQLVTSHDSSQHTSSEGRHYLTIYWLAVP